ncbi:hypothetical protein V1525DRAFT_210006 [Lipomyces kononenkoae]|uniref:Uncharacterized protein n=1 Tax=Lipomyces kononenkoae TaxID=34357 RepID=A0ACC3T9J3_LIPKO
MYESRASSPMPSSNELLDHRNQPETLPIRGPMSDTTQTASDVVRGIHGSAGSSGSTTTRPRLSSGRLPELAVYDVSPYETEAEDESIPPTKLRRKSALPPVRTGESVVINMADGAAPSSALSPDIIAVGKRRRSRRASNEPRSRRPTVSEDAIARGASRLRRSASSRSQVGADEQAVGAVNEKDNSSKADSCPDSDDSHPSSANSGDETEEDVCFPMHLEHQRINGIDFDEIEEFAAAQRLEQWYPSQTRPSGNNAGGLGRRLTFSVADRASAEGVGPKGATVIDVSTTSTGADEEKYGLSANEDIELLKRTTLPPDAAARLAAEDDRFSLFCSESEETIHAPQIGLLTGPRQTFAQLFDKANGTWWLDCLDPTDAEMRMLAKAFGIHPLTTEDIRVQETREKVELFRSYYFVCFRTFEHDKVSEEFLEPLNMYMVVFRDGILSFHFSPFQHTINVRRRIRQLRDYVTVSADWICYALIDDITDGFAPVIHEIEREADGIEDSVFVARESDFGDMLKRIGEARRTVMTLMRLLSGKADVIKMFAKRCNEQWDVAPKGEIGLYLGDIQDHIITMFQNLSAYEKILSRSHANYLAQLQVESFYANNRVTNMLSKVTLLGTILIPLNLITGLFGMNVRVPGVGGDDLNWFFGIVGVIFLIVIVSFYLARRWLDNVNRQAKRFH